jgi:hypothetical protein
MIITIAFTALAATAVLIAKARQAAHIPVRVRVSRR